MDTDSLDLALAVAEKIYIVVYENKKRKSRICCNAKNVTIRSLQTHTVTSFQVKDGSGTENPIREGLDCSRRSFVLLKFSAYAEKHTDIMTLESSSLNATVWNYTDALLKRVETNRWENVGNSWRKQIR